MRLPTLKEIFLSELLVHGPKPKEGSYIVAYKENLWVLEDRNNLGQFKDEIINVFWKELGSGRENDETTDSIEDVNSLIDYAESNKLPVIIGEITKNKMLYLLGQGSFNHDPRSSVAIKKVVDQLKLKGVSRSTGDYDEEETKKKQIVGQIPQNVFHGTSSKYLEQIMRLGLTPQPAQSNYPLIDDIPEGLIFFTGKFDESKHHAEHTANRTKSDPVILELSIPDRAKIVADYDIAKNYKNPEKISILQEYHQ